MSTKIQPFKLALLAAGALLTGVLASGCITHPPGGNTSKEGAAITHPPGGDDNSKEGPHRRHARH